MSFLEVLNKKSLISYEGRDIPSYLSQQEVSMILDACKDKRDHLLINLAWQTGARVSEIINLRVQDIDFYNHLIRFVTLKRRGKKSREVHRTIPVHSDLIAEISAFILEKGIKERIFNTTRQRVFQIVRKRAKEAGIEKAVHPHTLRHSFAVNCLTQGMPITVLKDLLGHSSILTTMVYLKIVRQDARVFLSQVRF